MTPDIPITIFVTVFLSVLAWVLPKRFAIVPLCIVMCAYPSNLLFPPAAMQLTPQRIVGLVLFIRCLTKPDIRDTFKWALVDTGAAVYFGLMMLAQLTTTEPVSAINNRAGFFLSALVPFWCVRLLVVDRPALYVFMKTFLWTALPLSLMACYQAKFGDSPYRQIMQYGTFWLQISDQWRETRLFLGMKNFRASAPFQQCIMFGWFFAIQITPATNLFWQKRHLRWWLLPWIFLPVGVVATVSAGPMMMAGISFMIAGLFPFRKFWKAGFGTAIGAYVGLTLLARRAPMEIVASFGLDASSSYYRVNLIDFTMRAMADHWVFGYGMIPPVYDILHHDLCIQWICLVVFHGFAGVIGFYFFVITAALCLWKAKKKSQAIADEWLCWTLMATLIASLLAMQLVALFAEMFFLYHVFLGLIANTMIICGSSDDRHVGVLAEINGRQVMLRYKLKPGQKLALVRPASRPGRSPGMASNPIPVD